MRLTIATERWPRATPLRITGYVFEAVEMIVVTLEADGQTGRGEAAGVYSHAETPAVMTAMLEAIRADIERGLTRAALQALLPPGGVRHALDAALWDLEAQRSGTPVWALAGLPEPRPLLTTFTCGADAPEAVVAKARSFKEAKAIKLKLSGDGGDAARVAALRAALPEIWLMVDANQGFDRAGFEAVLPALLEARVALIEQPFPVGCEAWLDQLSCPIPIAADESVQSLADLDALVGRFQMVNIKLDKAGGLTHALAMVKRARELGLDLMVGSMGGTALGMAPAYLVGQLCQVVDLDGPALLAQDRAPVTEYAQGRMSVPQAMWGCPQGEAK